MDKLKLGLIVPLRSEPKEEIEKVRRLGFPTCQVNIDDVNLYNRDVAKLVKLAAKDFDIEVTTVWAGLGGRLVWDFVGGPSTIGLVPLETRRTRLKVLRKASDFTREVEVESVTTHVGFIPENPTDMVYVSLVDALKEVAEFCEANGQSFSFETGQETPVTLLRTIQDIGTVNLGVNFDPANLLMYGKANPVDALDIIGTYVRGVHAKDGEYPTQGRELGKEKPLGEGRVNFPVFVPKLKKMGYTGALTIEREISGLQQIEDIKRAKALLEKLC